VDVNIGAVRLAATPFPLAPAGLALPRWSVRAGYTHWWVGDGGSAGYTTGFLVIW
jgi:hypothetical protein